MNLSHRELLVLLAKYLKSEAASSSVALTLHDGLGDALARIIAGESPNSVLHTGIRGRPVSAESQAFQSAVAGYLAWRRDEGSSKKVAVGEVAQLLKISEDDVLNADRAHHDVEMKGSAFALLAQIAKTTPAQVLEDAYSAHVIEADIARTANHKKRPKKSRRGK